MAEYIEREAALSVAAEWCPDDDGSVGKIGDLREMLDELEALPAASVRENVTGEWILIDGEPHCSRCGLFPDFITKFCPNCGADMRGGNDG